MMIIMKMIIMMINGEVMKIKMIMMMIKMMMISKMKIMMIMITLFHFV